MPTDRDALVQKVLDLKDASLKARGSKESKWATSVDYYRNITGKSDQDYFIPETYTVIETMLPRLVSPFLNRSKSFISVEGRNPNDHERAKIVEQLLNYEFQRCDLSGKLVEFYRDALIYGTAFGRVYWRYELKKKEYEVIRYSSDPITGEAQEIERERIEREEPIWDDPFFEVVSVYNMFIDPACASLDGEEPARYVIQKKLLSREEVMTLWESGWFNRDKDVQDLLNDKAIWSGMMESAEQDERDKEQTKVVYEQENLEGKCEILEYWSQDEVLVVAGEKYLLRKADNKLGFIPFVSVTYQPLPHEFYGLGVPEIISSLQEILNDIANLRLENVKLALRKPALVNAGIFLTPSDYVLKAGKAIPVRATELDRAIKYIDIPDVTQGSYQEQNVLFQGIQNATGVNDYIRGMPSDIMPKQTATEVLSKTQQASTRFEFIFKHMARSVLKIAQMFLRLSQLYITDQKLIKIVDKHGRVDFKKLTADDIIGEYDIILSVDPLRSNEQVRRQALLQFMDFAMRNPAVAQMVNWRNLAEAFLESLDLDSKVFFLNMNGEGGVMPNGDEGIGGQDNTSIEEVLQNGQEISGARDVFNTGMEDGGKFFENALGGVQGGVGTMPVG